MGDPLQAEVGVGDLIAGKYLVERVIGQGGMANVIAARHVDLDDVRAIKVLRRDQLANGKLVERFLREARAIARLKSDHVVRVYDVGRTDDGLPYIVMEHLEGLDLNKLVRLRGSLPIHEAVECLLQVCEAMIEAHAHGIFHRDLKPANLLFTFRPDGATAIKVLDFGIAKMTTLQGDLHALTTRTERLGTPAYMAPEQVLSLSEADARSDVWAMGAILFELISGQRPFCGENVGDTLTLVLKAPPKPLRALRPDVPPELAAVIARCLKKDPAQRFQTAEELRGELRKVVDEGLAAAHEEPSDLDPTLRLPASIRRISSRPAPMIFVQGDTPQAATWRLPPADTAPLVTPSMPSEPRSPRARRDLIVPPSMSLDVPEERESSSIEPATTGWARRIPRRMKARPRLTMAAASVAVALLAFVAVQGRSTSPAPHAVVAASGSQVVGAETVRRESSEPPAPEPPASAASASPAPDKPSSVPAVSIAGPARAPSVSPPRPPAAPRRGPAAPKCKWGNFAACRRADLAKKTR